ncbi:MAG TPA: DUF364 domain-containing protein [Polyangiaceae bacterium]|nr:DUF364 domain-containing protein [Polyangiaceae bacterium]
MSGSKTSDIYEVLQRRAAGARSVTRGVKRVVLGLNWSLAEVDSIGLCFTPGAQSSVGQSRTLEWPGTLTRRSPEELASWLRSADPLEATIGMCITNALVNDSENACLKSATRLGAGPNGHLAVFAHFDALLGDARVAVVGRYPGLEVLWRHRVYQCVERRPFADTLPESEAERVLKGADWVFVTASALPNHSLPRLLEQARGASVVLMGPTLPWLEEWRDFGVDYLAGVGVENPEELGRVVSEAGGTRIFEGAVSYRLLALGRASI